MYFYKINKLYVFAYTLSLLNNVDILYGPWIKMFGDPWSIN